MKKLVQQGLAPRSKSPWRPQRVGPAAHGTLSCRGGTALSRNLQASLGFPGPRTFHVARGEQKGHGVWGPLVRLPRRWPPAREQGPRA